MLLHALNDYLTGGGTCVYTGSNGWAWWINANFNPFFRCR